jgi:hypothetical protein
MTLEDALERYRTVINYKTPNGCFRTQGGGVRKNGNGMVTGRSQDKNVRYSLYKKAYSPNEIKSGMFLLCTDLLIPYF